MLAEPAKPRIKQEREQVKKAPRVVMKPVALAPVTDAIEINEEENAAQSSAASASSERAMEPSQESKPAAPKGLLNLDETALTCTQCA